jgi:hypothetical protein
VAHRDLDVLDAVLKIALHLNDCALDGEDVGEIARILDRVDLAMDGAAYDERTVLLLDDIDELESSMSHAKVNPRASCASTPHPPSRTSSSSRRSTTSAPATPRSRSTSA